MLDEPSEMLQKMSERAKRRSAIIWSAGSITGYVWDVIRNIIVLLIVLAIYDRIYESASVIVTSVLIFIYLNTISVGAQLAQSLAETNLRIYAHSDEILKKLGKEKDEDADEEFEKAGFMMEKIRYKFFLNSFFSFVIFIIALSKLLGEL